MRTTFVPIKKDVNIIETEARLLGSTATIVSDPVVRRVRPWHRSRGGRSHRRGSSTQATGHSLRSSRDREDVLGRTRGGEPRGVRAWFGLPSRELDPAKREQLRQSGAVEVCAFHPAYGYEDFLEGFRPSEKGGAIAFQLRDGVFKRLCAVPRTTGKPHFF